MNQKKRVIYLDMAKGVGILLMIAGHLIGALQGIDNKPYFAPAYQFITSFHMPLFFILSGILLFLTGEENKEMGVIVRRKARSLMLPYASFSLIYMVMNIWTCIFQPELLTFPELWKFFIYSVTCRGVSVLWFLPTLFFGELLFLWARKRFQDGRFDLLILIAGFFMFFFSPLFQWEGWESGKALMTVGALLQTAARSILATLFLLIGYRAARLLAGEQKKRVLEFLGGILLLAATGFLCFQNSPVDMNFMIFDNFILYILCACTGSFGVILLCRNIPKSRLLLFYGTNSLVIMATHMEFKVMLHSIQFAYWLNQYVTRAKEWVLFLTLAATITVLEAGIVFLYNHYFYFLLGRKKPEKVEKTEKEAKRKGRTQDEKAKGTQTHF